MERKKQPFRIGRIYAGRVHPASEPRERKAQQLRTLLKKPLPDTLPDSGHTPPEARQRGTLDAGSRGSRKESINV
jgi:hypothetical protein